MRVAMAVLLLGVGGLAPGCGSEAPPEGGTGRLHAHQLETPDGRTRSYHVYVPADREAPSPLLLVFHGGGGSALQAMRGAFTLQAADAARFIAVYPQGIGPRRLGRQFGTWNGGQCCGAAAQQGVDDVAFVAALLDRVQADYAIDASRIYATGISNGGVMAARLACELSGRIAAISAVAGPGYTHGCQPERPMPVQLIHGTADRCALYAGGEACGGCFQQVLRDGLGIDIEEARFPCQGVVDQAAHYRRVNGCDDASRVVYERGAARCVAWQRCASDQPVELCSVEGGGHVWPGRSIDCDRERRSCQAYVEAVGPETSDLDANVQIPRFLRNHALAR